MYCGPSRRTTVKKILEVRLIINLKNGRKATGKKTLGALLSIICWETSQRTTGKNTLVEILSIKRWEYSNITTGRNILGVLLSILLPVNCCVCVSKYIHEWFSIHLVHLENKTNQTWLIFKNLYYPNNIYYDKCW